jgi:hypothetical protein
MFDAVGDVTVTCLVGVKVALAPLLSATAIASSALAFSISRSERMIQSRFWIDAAVSYKIFDDLMA